MKNRKQLPSTSPNHSFFLWRITCQFLTAWVACWSLVIPAERKDENSFRRIHCSGFAIFSPLVEEKIYLRIPNSHVGLPATNFQALKMQFKARSSGSTQAPVLGENLCLRSQLGQQKTRTSANLASLHGFTYSTMVKFEVLSLVYHICSKGKGKERKILFRGNQKWHLEML